MNVPVIAFFNNKGGVGKTSLVYHIAWMLADQDYRIIAVDLDPQGNLSAAFLDDDRLEELWPEDQHPATIYDSVVIPHGPDLFSLQGLRNLGPTLRTWRSGWTERLEKNPAPDLQLPDGRMEA